MTRENLYSYGLSSISDKEFTLCAYKNQDRLLYGKVWDEVFDKETLSAVEEAKKGTWNEILCDNNQLYLKILDKQTGEFWGEISLKDLGLRNQNGDYNLLAQLLSDNSHFPLRVSIFDGETKGSDLFSVREFGNNCLLYTLDEILRYGDVINLIQTDERERVVERPEIPLFDNKAFREAIINAILHGQVWI